MKTTISQLLPGQEFYFENNKSDLFIFLSMQPRNKAKCCRPGKLYPCYFSTSRQVILLPAKII